MKSIIKSLFNLSNEWVIWILSVIAIAVVVTVITLIMSAISGVSTDELNRWLERPVSEVKTWHLLLCIYAIAVFARASK